VETLILFETLKYKNMLTNQNTGIIAREDVLWDEHSHIGEGTYLYEMPTESEIKAYFEKQGFKTFEINVWQRQGRWFFDCYLDKINEEL
jgi:hypothetical protein